MKTSLIHLSSAADWRAAVVRVRGGRQERVILVWRTDSLPKGQSISRYNPRLVLRLMQRRSLRKSVPLAVVTTNSYLRAESEKLGLPLFANTRQARSAEWGLSQPNPMPAQLHPRAKMKDLRALSSRRRAAALH